MFKKEKPLVLKSSASSLSNNLAVLVSLDKGILNYAVVHKAVVNVISASTDGATVNSRNIVCKEPSATQQSTPMVMQGQADCYVPAIFFGIGTDSYCERGLSKFKLCTAKWVTLPQRTIFVLTSLKGIQMFESDGSAMIYWHALGDINSTDILEHANFGRGITGLGENYVCVGTQLGEIHVFNIPAKGTNITLKESLVGHKYPVCDLASDSNRLISSDEQGNILIWTLTGASLKQTYSITGSGSPCSSLILWRNVIAAGFGNGQIRLYCAKSGKLAAQSNAHARWVTALDVANDAGMLLSASEDSFVKLWKLKEGDMPEIEYLYQEQVENQQLVGVQFLHPQGRAFCVTGYDSCDLSFYVTNASKS